MTQSRYDGMSYDDILQARLQLEEGLEIRSSPKLCAPCHKATMDHEAKHDADIWEARNALTRRQRTMSAQDFRVQVLERLDQIVVFLSKKYNEDLDF